MNKHYSYPSIPQFRTLVSDITHSTRYIGQNKETGKPMYDENKALPTITIEGTVKLHGANCSVVLTRKGIFYPQSKETLLDEKVNCDKFYQFAMEREEFFRTLLASYLVDTANDVEAVVLYGEWCGPKIQKGVAISQIEEPIFAVFDVRLIDSTYEKGGTGFINTKLHKFHRPENRVYSIHSMKTFEIKMDIANPELSQAQLVEYTSQVEKECPFAKELGIVGRGEGIVWSIFYNGIKWRMKVKGQKHSSTKVKVLANPDFEKIESIAKFIEYAFTTNRLEQGISVLKQRGIEITKENTEHFVRWVFSDVIKEEKDTMDKNGITTKDIAKKGNYLIRQFYMTQVDK